MDKLKVGLIGTGYIGMIHLEMLRRLANIEIVAVADSNKKSAENAAKKFAVPKVFYNSAALIQDKEVEVIHNCTPNFLHFAINAEAIQAGKEVLSEKPLALSSKESAQLVALVEKFDTVHGINFCYRYYPVLQEAAARVRRGDLGKVNFVLGHFLQDWLSFETDYSWRLDSSVAGASNTMADLGSHWCDLVQFITGLKITEIMAEFHSILPSRKKPKAGILSFGAAESDDLIDVKIPVEDYATIFIRLENGARGNFSTCQLAIGKKVDIDLQIYGSKESYSWNHVHPNAIIIGHRDRGNEIFYESPRLQTEDTRKYASLPTGHPIGYHDTIYNFFMDFYAAVAAKREGKKIPKHFPDFYAGHSEMKIIEAAIKSSQSGNWEKV
jgi:predicted dehydrogenase